MEQAVTRDSAPETMDPAAAAAAAASPAAQSSSISTKKTVPRVHFTAQTPPSEEEEEEPSPPSSASFDSLRRGRGRGRGEKEYHMKLDIPATDPANFLNSGRSTTDFTTTPVYTPSTPYISPLMMENISETGSPTGSTGEGYEPGNKPQQKQREKQSNSSSGLDNGGGGGSGNNNVVEEEEAPEKLITLVVVRLTLLEKAATNIGTLTFVWATVILLGGFSVFLDSHDFWLVTMLLCTEGTRIFSRSHELEWQHVAAGSSLSIFHLPQWLRKASAAVVQSGSDAVHKSKRFVSDLVSHPPHDQHKQQELPEQQIVVYQQQDSIATTTKKNSNNSLAIVPVYWKALDSDSSSGSSVKAPVISKRALRIGEAARAPSLNRSWYKPGVPLLPWLSIFSAKTVSLLMSCLQICSAFLCLAISLWRLALLPGDYAPDISSNVPWSLYLFYSLSLLEASIFLTERSYWSYEIRWGRLLQTVKAKAGLEDDDEHHVQFLQTFFYEVYAKCLSGSVFDGLDMNLVGYSLGLIQSDDAKKVLSGIRVLKALAYHESVTTRNDTFHHIGITIGAIDRLVEMLAWRNPHEMEIRRHAAAVVKKLVHFTRNCSRVAAVVGSLQNIASLLYYDDEDVATHYSNISDVNWAVPPLEIVELQTYGLGILTCLATDHRLCLQIGETRGLLPILVDNIEVHYRIMQIPADLKSPYRRTIGQSLRLLKMLTGTTGYSGKQLRPAIASVVSTIPHVRDILEYKERFGDFQRFAVEILTNLALDEASRETIGSTGGVIKSLMVLLARQKVSFRSNVGGDQVSPLTPMSAKEAEMEEIAVAAKAGEALTRLVLKNKKNCERILKVKFTHDNMDSLDILVKLLQNDDVANAAAKILRSIFQYTNKENERQIAMASEFLMAKVVKTSDEAQEAALGLVAKTMPILHDDEFDQIWTSKISREAVVTKMLSILQHVPTTTRSPCRRRYAIELIIVLLKRDEEFLLLFANFGLVQELNRTLLSISDVENFLLFSGGGGLVRHSEEMENLIEKALRIFNPLDDSAI